MIKKKLLDGRGSVAIIYMILLSVLAVVIVSAASISLSNRVGIEKSYRKTLALNIAEGGVEKAIWELKRGNGSYSGETASSLIPGGQFDVAVADGSNPNEKIITATGYVPSKSDPKYTKTIRIKVTATPTDQSIAFTYAVQTGDYGLTMYANSKVEGTAYSNGSIVGYSNSVIQGSAYAVGTISSPRPSVTGGKYPGSPSEPFPEVDIDFWKNAADANNDAYIGNYAINSGSQTLGPRKIIGDFTMNNNSALTLTGPLYVTGNFSMNSNTDMYLSSSLNNKGTVILVDGTITLNSNSVIHDLNDKGHVLFISTNSGYASIQLNSNVEGGIYYTDTSRIQLNSNAEVVAVVGRGLILNSNAEIDYHEGMSMEFSGGPGGTWNVKEWQEIRAP